jgi:dephospho-CoA kinase
MTRRIALTGGIATGKSHVRAQFETLGVPTIDADVLARQAVEPGTPGLAAVIARFGPEILDASGTLDRAMLASIVFADAPARRDLEGIVHPAVRRAIDDWFASLDGSHHPFALADIPLLYETGRDRDFEAIVVAACDTNTQLRRLMARDTLTEEEALRRIAAQMPIDEKVNRADYVIRTDGPFEETNRQVREIADRLAGDSGNR